MTSDYHEGGEWTLADRRVLRAEDRSGLLGFAPGRSSNVPRLPAGLLPVVVLTGGHGSGRTTCLRGLWEETHERVPTAWIDLGEAGERAGALAEVSNASPVVEVLVRLVEGLVRPVPGFGRLRLDRLVTGLIGTCSWHQGYEQEETAGNGRVARLYEACGITRCESEPGHAEQELQDRIRRRLKHFTGNHLPSDRAKRVLAWYGDPEGGAGRRDGVQLDPLVTAAERFYRGGDYRRRTEHLLVAALLADMVEEYGTTWRRWNRTPRPLVLLDDARSGSEEGFVELLLAERERRVERGAEPDQLVVAVGHLGTSVPRGWRPVSRRLPSIPQRRQDRRGKPPGPAGVVTLPLPPLRREQVMDYLEGLDAGKGLPAVVHGVTRGNVLGVRLLCEALRERTEGELPENLLELPGRDGRNIGEVLLERLVPENLGRAGLRRDFLELLAAAGTRRAAVRLVDRFGQVPSPSQVEDASRYLADEGWSTGGQSGPPVADPFLRGLLLHGLRAPGARPGWLQVHRFLARHHREEGDEANMLRCLLSCGDAADVVAALAASFHEHTDATRWLRTLRHVASAPRPPSPDWFSTCREFARGLHDAEYTDRDDVHRSINRLLHALWYLADDLSAPEEDGDILPAVARDLEFLSVTHPTGYAAFASAGRDWPPAARDKRPWPLMKENA